mmetsp:Transcript_49571/g.142673  ORF Transcript_49571/g.142673 Transcript_49571/m.142673 type:complete len:264 (-) Transcript_49571:17-808(-)
MRPHCSQRLEVVGWEDIVVDALHPRLAQGLADDAVVDAILVEHDTELEDARPLRIIDERDLDLLVDVTDVPHDLALAVHVVVAGPRSLVLGPISHPRRPLHAPDADDYDLDNWLALHAEVLRARKLQDGHFADELGRPPDHAAGRTARDRSTLPLLTRHELGHVAVLVGALARQCVEDLLHVRGRCRRQPTLDILALGLVRRRRRVPLRWALYLCNKLHVPERLIAPPAWHRHLPLRAGAPNRRRRRQIAKRLVAKSPALSAS